MSKITVLMSTYNGEKYLRPQLESIFNQKGVSVNLLVRDDGSTDNTLNILREYAQQGKLTYYTGPNLKPAYSFLDLVAKAPASDFYAFSDQDDYWFEDKLLRAVSQIKSQGQPQTPTLYYARPLETDKNLTPLSPAPVVDLVTSFKQAMLTSCALGCTMVFNQALCRIIRQYRPEFLMMHDYWICQLAWGIGGKVVYDNERVMYYRRHENNVCGKEVATGWKQRLKYRWQSIIHNGQNNSRQLQQLVAGYGHLLQPENLAACRTALNYKRSFIGKCRLLKIAFGVIKNRSDLRNLCLRILLGVF